MRSCTVPTSSFERVCSLSWEEREREREALYIYNIRGPVAVFYRRYTQPKQQKIGYFFPPIEASQGSSVSSVSPSIVTATYETQYVHLLSASIICQKESGHHSRNLCVVRLRDKLRCANRTSRKLSVKN